MRLRFLPLLVSLVSSPALAITVYKWVDENGRVSFADQPPATSGAVETLHLHGLTPVDSTLTEQRLARMREVTDRMARDRREREKQRTEQRKARQLASQVESHYYPVYGGGRRYYPRPPIGRPPGVKPLPTGRRAITSDYPAKLVRQHYNSVIQRREFLRSTGLIHRQGSWN
jgi:hypothetical protein